MTDIQKRALQAIETLRARVRELEGAGNGFAIVGYAARFPGAADADEFWDVLRKGRDAVSEVPAGPLGCRRILRPGSRCARQGRDPPGGFRR